MVPDFRRNWLPTKKQSIFADWETSGYILRPAQPGDPSQPQWIGHVSSYRTKDNLARGVAYALLDQEEIYELWGLKDEPLSRAAVLVGDTWVSFSRSKFTFRFHVHSDGRGRTHSVSIFVYANTDPELVRFAVSILKQIPVV